MGFSTNKAKGTGIPYKHCNYTDSKSTGKYVPYSAKVRDSGTRDWGRTDIIFHTCHFRTKEREG